MIASRLGVAPVSCLVDKTAVDIRIQAQFSGVPPKNRIIFTRQSLDFLTDNTDIAEAIIAHEIAHLKYDCKRFRLLEILSRLGLVGPAFLSVFHDSFAIEDRADDLTRQYLDDNGLNKSLLDEAKIRIDLQRRLIRHGRAQCPYSANSGLNLHPINRRSVMYGKVKHFIHDTVFKYVSVGIGVIRTIHRNCRTITRFYFDMEWYDYCHRSTAYHIARLIQK